MSRSNIVEKVENYVFDQFKSSKRPNLLFHDYKHFSDVTAATIEIGEASGLSADELEILQIAAWFHDIGYLQKNEGHEELSVEVAKEFLLKEKYKDGNILKVVDCILATKKDVEPSSLLEEIMCDSDTLNIGSPEYLNRSKLLKLENIKLCDASFTELEWIKWELDFLSKHRFYTKYANINYNEGKAKNILIRQAEYDKIDKKHKDLKEKSHEKEFKIKKSEVPARGVETMFRTTLRNHINLSAIADNKANLMLSVNAVIISITVSLMLPNYKSIPELIIPTVFLLLVCLLSIIFATLSTRPKVTRGTFTKEDVKAKKANLLFFGNFYNTPLEEFQWGMKEMMTDKDFLYGSLIRDLHSLGKVLNNKYRYLRLTYNIFMYGMILAVILFGVFMSIENPI